MEMVGHSYSLESTAYCTYCQILFFGVQLCSGHTCSPCMGKGHLHVPVVQQLGISPGFWYLP